MNACVKQKQTHRLTENKLIVTKGEMKQGDTKWGMGVTNMNR